MTRDDKAVRREGIRPVAQLKVQLVSRAGGVDHHNADFSRAHGGYMDPAESAGKSGPLAIGRSHDLRLLRA